jgi:hypothetical protein
VGIDAEHRAVVARSASRRALLELGLVVTVPLLLLTVLYFHWGAGPQRLLALTVLFGFVAWVSARRGYVASLWESDERRWLLAACVVALFGLHVSVFAHDIARGGECLTDMGRPSICAGEWLRQRLNPWAECVKRPRGPLHVTDTWTWCLAWDGCIDRKAGGTYQNWTHHGPGFDFMDGFKYGPLAALAYMPFVHSLRERGLFSVNFACWLVQFALLGLLARAAYPRVRSAPWRSWLILLLPSVIPNEQIFPSLKIHALGGVFPLVPPEQHTLVLELTQRCSNDIIPVVLVLGATLLAARGRSLGAGVLLGLSLAAKQLPGLLLCCLLPRLQGVRPLRLLAAAVATAAFVYLPFFVWAPREMFANLVLFSLLRPTNSSSIRGYIPAEYDGWVSLAQLVVVALVLGHFYWRSARDLPALLRSVTLLTIGFVALNKVVHGNYLLWLEPWLALVLGGIPYAPAPFRPAPREVETLHGDRARLE